jgi:diadenosine tetraphosphate (Ap4A) HIT family hydrolase
VKLNEEIVARMRARYNECGNAAQVAREFNVNHTHAHRIVRGEAWRELSVWSR